MVNVGLTVVETALPLVFSNKYRFTVPFCKCVNSDTD